MDNNLKRAAKNYHEAAELLVLRAELLEAATGVMDPAVSLRHARGAASMLRFLEVLDIENFATEPESVLVRMAEHLSVEIR